jgi:general secretion pathway protein I
MIGMDNNHAAPPSVRWLGFTESGFTLLEAIVAMVLISGAGLALFGWINANLSTLGRVKAVSNQVEATQNILEYMVRVNPMLTPEGEVDFGSYRLSWQAEPVTAIQDGYGYPAGISLYQFALYDTKVNISKPEGGAWFDLQLRQTGYKKVRNSNMGE